MITPGNPYYAQVNLLVRVLPVVAREGCFALKGGTAINLFVRDLPRLSVDIDLAYLPVGERTAALKEIDAALGRIAASLADRPHSFQVRTGKYQEKKLCGLPVSLPFIQSSPGSSTSEAATFLIPNSHSNQYLRRLRCTAPLRLLVHLS